ncbi:hypothetical protein BS78_07G082300 [Paspalum vaginatum]|nr:hypothetical protein BS78_07G082300 [Paspalum vaginatum]
MVVEAVVESGSPAALGAGAGAGAGDGSMAVHGHRLSTVVPSSVTGESVDYELADADLLHKLHYVRAVHVFRAPAAPGERALSVRELKEPMFPWLDMYFPVSGRLRRRQQQQQQDAAEAAAGRPYVRCNDCGVRVVEAACDATVEQWMEAEDERGGLCRPLAYDKVIGPELFFSPLLYVQITSFKCGGMALGFTWAHVIGGIPSAAACFATWAQLASGNKAPPPALRDPLSTPPPPPAAPPASETAPPPSAVKATSAPVGDHWAVPAARNMVPFSFHVTEQQLKALQQRGARPGGAPSVGPFELVSALVWRGLAAIRASEDGEEATRTVTVVRTTQPAVGGGSNRRPGLANKHRIGQAVASGAAPAAADVAALAALLAGARVDDAGAVAAQAAGDVVVYGACLTFVDAGGVVEAHPLELAGRRPAHVEYAVDGVGDGGAAVVHAEARGRGRTVAGALRRGEPGRLRDALRAA